MGVIWLQTSGGRLIHMPVVGGDVNSPGDAIKIPTSFLKNVNRVQRALDGSVTVVHPTYGSITFDFSVPGRTGSCNQCGSCCSHPIVDCKSAPDPCGYIVNPTYPDDHVCQYLTIDSGKKKLGNPGCTECSLRTTIFDTFKGCTLFPSIPEEIRPHMTNCGFSFE